MKRVLQLTDTIEKRNGRMSVVMNVYRKINKENIQFDFLVTDYGHENYYDEITKLGGHVYFLSSRDLSLSKIKDKFLKVIHLRKYDFVHYHALSKWGECISYAKQHGIKVIVHSHATELSDNFVKSIRNRIFSLNILTCADERVAVSPEAGKKLFLWQNFEYIPNMIDYDKFKYSNITRNKIREKYNFSNDDKVIGIVGRISKQKNQKFALAVLRQLIKENKNYKLLVIGEYDDKGKKYFQMLKSLIRKYGLERNVIFTGIVLNVWEYYSSLDLLWIPSLYEGMPTVAIEAEANGVPIILSSQITKSLKINGNVSYLKVNNCSLGSWVSLSKRQINSREFNSISNIKETIFNSKRVLTQWMRLYGL
ncbi:glycosyl transferase [Lentilactobacillus buchneri subsp. silagei]|uniref:glycosyltransferase n=1 Tax=Lentilactobacillus buchneri TaxID=1581 RepID=UPI0012E59681|nr:glycosyltransferase [Lentilactobacillus buchneri]GED95615.1 glycosyl transferase [Lentilactobacillus buchneri subsp. silagei]